MSDLIRTIEDEQEPENFSGESESEEEYQPTRKRKVATKKGGLESTFSFAQHTKDIWSERIEKLAKANVKKPGMTAKTSLDDKISRRKLQKSKEKDSDDDDTDDESEEENVASAESEEGENGFGKGSEDEAEDTIYLSDDELRKDEIRVKNNKKNRKALRNQAADMEDDDDDVGISDPSTNQSFDTSITFQQMNLSRPLLKSINALGFVHPTPIQAAAIPIALGGRDICGCAATGTGKTAAYMLPVLERLLYKPKAQASTRVLCLVPTRELGIQVFTVTRQLASFSSDIQVALAVGGLELQAQEAELRRNPDIVIATPGRLIDHLGNTPSFTLDSIEILILDEADRMLDDWFAEQLKEIVKQCSPRRQTLLFSATMTEEVKDLATVSLKNPAKIFVDSNKTVACNLSQQFVKVKNETDREAMLCALVVRTFHSQTMVFVPTKKIAHRLHIVLGLMGIRISELHGDLTQMQRMANLKKFQNSEVDVLIVTDVAARGLDIPGVTSVVNYAMPKTLEQYIHRCGRTARAGRSGLAVSLVGESDRRLMKQVAKSSTLPVKARLIPTDIVIKYRTKIKSLDGDIESIMGEETAEKCIAKAEIEASKALKLVEESKKGKKKKKKGKHVDDDKRVWFQSHKDRMSEKDRLTSKARLNSADRKDVADADDQFVTKKLIDYQVRQAKRKGKGKSKGDSNGISPGGQRSGGSGGKKQKKRSAFDDKLVNTSKARQFRSSSKKQFGRSKR